MREDFVLSNLRVNVRRNFLNTIWIKREKNNTGSRQDAVKRASHGALADDRKIMSLITSFRWMQTSYESGNEINAKHSDAH